MIALRQAEKEALSPSTALRNDLAQLTLVDVTPLDGFTPGIQAPPHIVGRGIYFFTEVEDSAE